MPHEYAGAVDEQVDRLRLGNVRRCNGVHDVGSYRSSSAAGCFDSRDRLFEIRQPPTSDDHVRAAGGHGCCDGASDCECHVSAAYPSGLPAGSILLVVL